VNKTSTLPPLIINKNFPIINDGIQCNGPTPAFEAVLDMNANMAVSVGVVASGTIVPPEVSDFFVVLGLSCDSWKTYADNSRKALDSTINGTLNLRTDVTVM
jgi:hypothetical protein